MDKGLYVSMTGAQSLLRAQAVVANNLANKDTAGYKAGVAMADDFVVPGPGFGTRVDAVPRAAAVDTAPGPVVVTGNDTDIALAPGAWLVVQAKDGREAYTRAGDLRIGGDGVLATHGGHPVLGENGPLAVPAHSRIQFGADGGVSIVPLGDAGGAQVSLGRLRLVDIPGDTPLVRGEDGLMRVSGAAPAPAPATGHVVTAGAIEGSNVEAANCLVAMIDISRQFELQVKLMRSGEEMARSSASMLRLGG